MRSKRRNKIAARAGLEIRQREANAEAEGHGFVFACADVVGPRIEVRRSRQAVGAAA